ncbi:transcription elongation factor SPT4-like [Harmonia axyridis]|uniref:transcription elongation factor SPT4-like n=1 Tax=Harmonia axyridis TaxID=115357 RepID=UPI001E277960|nr:transcription elongation factor SPT4-like [Harmonia axyridis]
MSLQEQLLPIVKFSFVFTCSFSVFVCFKMAKKSVDENFIFRACLGCYQVKSFGEFDRHGCENCDPCLKMKGNPDNIRKYTTEDFGGMVAKTPSFGSASVSVGSTEGVPGMYAITCNGILEQQKIQEMQQMGLRTPKNLLLDSPRNPLRNSPKNSPKNPLSMTPESSPKNQPRRLRKKKFPIIKL